MRQINSNSTTAELIARLETISAQDLKRLLEISTILSSTLDLKQLLDMVIDTATSLTDTENASILLIDQATEKLYTAASSGAIFAEESEVPLEGSVAGWIVQNGRPLIIDELQSSGQEYLIASMVNGVVPRNMLGVPLVTKDRVIGSLEAINKRGDAIYSQQDVALLQALASQAAVAIENARLFMQTDLISEFMHELKTPLMALTAASELLARETLDENSQELIEMIQRETMRLSKMAQDFLDLARLESGRAQLVQAPVNLSRLVDDVVSLQEAQAADRGITITTNFPEQLPIIIGDYNRLKQVLLNLTNNAIKYNIVQGQIIIAITDLDKEVMIAISDTGLGIAKENQAHLFERFYRIPDGEGFTEGTGLGLSISARIIQEHGGRIEVNSARGQGSTFRCYLPKSDG
jgi:signal transduction histidine kinase